MATEITVRGNRLSLSSDDLEGAADRLRGRNLRKATIHARIGSGVHPARQLALEMLRQKGLTIPDLTAYEAVRILRALGCEIVEQ